MSTPAKQLKTTAVGANDALFVDWYKVSEQPRSTKQWGAQTTAAPSLRQIQVAYPPVATHQKTPQ